MSGWWFNLFLVAVALVAGFLVHHWLRMQRVRDMERYGTSMMLRLGELDTGKERRSYLRSEEHIGRIGRCDCGMFALPFPSTCLITDDLTHARELCQPNREVVRESLNG